MRFDLAIQRVAAWSGVVMLVLFGIAFMAIGKLVPPLSPTSSASEIVDFLVSNKVRVRVGIALTLLAACVAFPFLAVIVLRVRRVEGRWGVLSLTQLLAAGVFVPGFLFPLMVLATAAYRPGQISPEITQALNDVFWLMFVGVVGTLFVQAIVLATASFLDTTEPRTFPRWFGYLNIWYAVFELPGGADVLFNSGPLAWNGVFAFWIPLGGFTIWMLTLTVVMDRSIKAEATAAHATAP